jgi:antitoxin ParD1/3/4
VAAEREDALKVEELRAQIRAGADALERGDFIEIEDSALEAYLERLAGTDEG